MERVRIPPSPPFFIFLPLRIIEFEVRRAYGGQLNRPPTAAPIEATLPPVALLAIV
jgi:hypothetical protein